MPASPGDFGIEGFVLNKGIAIQCYCPDKHYTQKELYENQRDKITDDLNKLKLYESDILERIGNRKISKWIFITPQVNNHRLLRHATNKAQEIQSWRLDLLDENVEVLIHDAGFYATEIRELDITEGKKVSFIPREPLQQADPSQYTEYDENIARKNSYRCLDEQGNLNLRKHQKLNERTSDNWINGDKDLKKIESEASEIFFKLEKCFTQFQIEVEEICITWTDTAEKLVEKVRSELKLRIKEAVPELNDTDRHKLANSMVSRWIALCPLELEP
ncbi:hypothetical protein [Agaribacterium haliotis]|uniref:hypothetical protein n=1 Tax=Agaribacterium haliotis TaxID=2013869 RepID=UPI001959B359|nr:hypothetical protein [Agaribacterium haliotis]